MKRTIQLKESELRLMIAESVRRVLKESGDSKRGSYMMGRSAKRGIIRGDNYSNLIDMRDKASDKEAFEKGMDDQGMYGKNYRDPSDIDVLRDADNWRKMKKEYDLYKMEDMDALGRKFIDFIENNGLETVIDYESGNQTGKKESPLKELIPYFEDEVLGYDCTPDMIDAITKAYNHWWYYAEGELMPYEEDEDAVDESIIRKINRIVSECIRRNIR